MLVCTTTPVALRTAVSELARVGSPASAVAGTSSGPMLPSRACCWAAGFLVGEPLEVALARERIDHAGELALAIEQHHEEPERELRTLLAELGGAKQDNV